MEKTSEYVTNVRHRLTQCPNTLICVLFHSLVVYVCVLAQCQQVFPFF